MKMEKNASIKSAPERVMVYVDGLFEREIAIINTGRILRPVK
jgi:hypothetical protein